MNKKPIILFTVMQERRRQRSGNDPGDTVIGNVAEHDHRPDRGRSVIFLENESAFWGQRAFFLPGFYHYHVRIKKE
jgi:hypothetical protein